MNFNFNFYQTPKIYNYLTPSEWALFTILYDEWQMMQNEEGWFFRSWKNLREDCGLSNDGLNSALKGLQNKAIISTRNFGKKDSKANEFSVNISIIENLSKPTPKSEQTYSEIGAHLITTELIIK